MGVRVTLLATALAGVAVAWFAFARFTSAMFALAPTSALVPDEWAMVLIASYPESIPEKTKQEDGVQKLLPRLFALWNPCGE